jgi:hypothetical protein
MFGRFCEVTASEGRFFGELVRISTALFFVRSRSMVASAPHPIPAAEIRAIADLPDPHL